jgi:hypothetical protein
MTCYCLQSVAREAAHNNAVALCYKMVGDPRPRRTIALNIVKIYDFQWRTN